MTPQSLNIGQNQQILTIFGCALALERHSPAAQAIAQAGHDVCCHGWRWMKHFELEEEEEREHIRKAIASLQQSVGTRPLGWYCRYGPNDELPYWVEVEGKRHLVVPYTLGVNDSKFGRGVFATGEDFYTYAKDSFDMLYREGERQPKMMSMGLHMRIIGHPGRAAGLERFLDHVLQHNGVWVCRREEIAQHWMSHHSA
jgi:allantoinase